MFNYVWGPLSKDLHAAPYGDILVRHLGISYIVIMFCVLCKILLPSPWQWQAGMHVGNFQKTLWLIYRPNLTSFTDLQHLRSLISGSFSVTVSRFSSQFLIRYWKKGILIHGNFYLVVKQNLKKRILFFAWMLDQFLECPYWFDLPTHVKFYVKLYKILFFSCGWLNLYEGMSP